VVGRSLLLALSLVPALAKADPACRREADGRVSCTSDGFASLVNVARSARAELEGCQTQLNLAVEQRDAAVADRDACEGRPIEPAPAPILTPARPSPFVVVGFAVGIVGALALGAAGASLLAGPQVGSSAVLALTGAGVVGLGAVLVSW